MSTDDARTIVRGLGTWLIELNDLSLSVENEEIDSTSWRTTVVRVVNVHVDASRQIEVLADGDYIKLIDNGKEDFDFETEDIALIKLRILHLLHL